MGNVPDTACENCKENICLQKSGTRFYKWRHTIDYIRCQGECGMRLWEIKTFNSSHVAADPSPATDAGVSSCQRSFGAEPDQIL